MRRDERRTNFKIDDEISGMYFILLKDSVCIWLSGNPPGGCMRIGCGFMYIYVCLFLYVPFKGLLTIQIESTIILFSKANYLPPASTYKKIYILTTKPIPVKHCEKVRFSNIPTCIYYTYICIQYKPFKFFSTNNVFNYLE